MPWLPTVGLLASFGMMLAGFLLMLDAGAYLVRKLREEDRA
ncbi:MAG TPA: hypothetical protein VFW45_12365 [Candidatus Polarisedimenticolia bacterium]|nr:hypothetical protein [Candidatus Polarisedimenticolia bacterium]